MGNHSVFLLVNGGVEWPSASVAIAIILVSGGVVAIAVIRFTMDELLKLWASVGTAVATIAGLVIGTFGTYFFTRQATQAKVQAALAQTRAAQTEVRLAERQLNTFRAASEAVKIKLSPQDAEWFGQMIDKGMTGMTTYDKALETPTPESTWWPQIYRRAETPTATPEPQ
jgi:hypothetical protein